MERKNIIFGIVGFIAVIFGFISKAFYRPYISMHHINDFGIADSSPSLFYVIGFSLLLLIKPNKHAWVVIIVVTLGSVAYEIMQAYNNRLLDFKDIIASLIGGIISILIWLTIKRNFTKQLNTNENYRP